MANTCYDRKSFDGNVLILSKIYKSFEQHKSEIISATEFNNNIDHLSKIKFLQEKGIKGTVSEGEYDFSNLKQYERTPQKAVAAKEEEIEDNLSSIFYI